MDRLIKNLLPWLIVSCGSVTLVQAADYIPRTNGDRFVMIYLAFCILIVLTQLIPAMMKLLSYIKAVKKEKPDTEAQI